MEASEKSDCLYGSSELQSKCFQEQIRSCLTFLTHRASHSLHSFDDKSASPKSKERRETWSHLPVAQMSRLHCKKNMWERRNCCGQFGKIQSETFYFLIGLAHPSLSISECSWLFLPEVNSFLSSSLFRNLILEVNSLISCVNLLSFFIKYI